VKDVAPEEVVTTITAGNSWAFFDFGELRRYRDLFYFLVWRDIKVLYAQTILGFSWAILNPLVQIVVFSVIFGRVARIDTDGIPYVLLEKSTSLECSSR
jgi:lipopolysaccharide transport system permease protein